MGTQIFQEQLDLTEAQADANERIIRNVVLIRAGMSKNKRFYSEGVLEKSASIFQDSKSYDNHQSGSRSIRDITGFYKNVRYESGALKADRHFTKNQAGQDAWAIASEVVSGNAPRSLAGLSINAVGSARKHPTEDGALEIESITAALSIDDVSEAAAKGSYIEGAPSVGDLTTAFWESVTLEEYTQARPDYIERLKKEWKSARQDDALKAALAESERLQAALKEAHTQIETLQAERDTAFIELEKASRVNALEQVLSKANVPADWKKPLRESLLKADESAWAGLIETEETKARSAGHRIAVNGASQQVNAPLKEAPKPKNALYDMSKVRGPEDLDFILKEA